MCVLVTALQALSKALAGNADKSALLWGSRFGRSQRKARHATFLAASPDTGTPTGQRASGAALPTRRAPDALLPPQLRGRCVLARRRACRAPDGCDRRSNKPTVDLDGLGFTRRTAPPNERS